MLLLPIEDDLKKVDELIIKQTQSDVALIEQISRYIISAGGKRIRPALLLLFARALDYNGEHMHALAAIIELIHTSSLLHDDVVDESDLRRGQPTSNASFGNAAAVLAGDFLYTRAFQMIVPINNQNVLKVLSEATNLIAEGEVRQLVNTRNTKINEKQYLDVIYAKTAKLFEASARLGAILANATEKQQQAAYVYGRALGIAFQLIDDVLDYTGKEGEIGKHIGDDLREGKMTLPLIRLMQTASETERKIIYECITEGRIGHFDAIISAIRTSDAAEYTQNLAKKFAKEAKDALNAFPDSQFKQSLLELASFAVSRTH